MSTRNHASLHLYTNKSNGTACNKNDMNGHEHKALSNITLRHKFI